MSAWRSVRGNIPKYRRTRSAGPDGVTLADYEQNLADYLKILNSQLLKGRYQPEPPAMFSIEKNNGEQRKLAILTVSDRVAQRAAKQVLEPLWEPHFLPCSFGFRPGLSIQDALNQAQQLRDQNMAWVVDGDVSSCFSSLDHKILMSQVKRKVQDLRVLHLVRQWIEVGVLEAGPPKEYQGLENFARSALRWGQKGADWLLARTTEAIDPYGSYPDYYPHEQGANYRYEEDRYDLGGNGNHISGQQDLMTRERRRAAMQRIAVNGLILGSGWMRSALASFGGKAISFVKSPAGRRVLKKTALTTGGVAGIAVTTLAAYFLQYHSDPSSTGVLQGSPLSPLLANIYLHLFDLMLTKRGYALVRFADDWVVLTPSRHKAEKAYGHAQNSLNRLNLDLNPEKTYIRAPNEEIKWLGGVIR